MWGLGNMITKAYESRIAQRTTILLFKTMKIINILKDWKYPVASYGSELSINCYTILSFISKRYETVQFVGEGGSGAMILGALSVINESQGGHNYRYIHINRHTRKSSFNDTPIIIIDDHILSGETLNLIKIKLIEFNRYGNVEGIIMTNWRMYDLIRSNTDVIMRLFPQAKFWIH